MGNKITCKRPSVDERYTRPQGLYPQRNVNRKKLCRLILNSKLAPCFPGEDETNADFEECPICFLYYPSLNQSKCCSKGVCTECFLQMKSVHATRATQCPFCKFHNYSIEYRGSKTIEEKGIEVVEEQKFIEAKIHMHKQDLLDNKDQREHFPSKASKDKVKNGSLLELSSLQSNKAIHIEMPQHVKFTFDVEKWKQNLCEPIYCYDQHWLRKPCGPSLSAGPSSFTTCGSHCESNCSKCLMTFHKRRIYDVLDVSTPQSRVMKENKFEPYIGRWPSTWRNHQSLLSQSFPLPTRMPNYHYCHNDILNSKALQHLLHDVSSNFDGISICEDPRIQKANNLTQEFMTSSMSKKSNSFDDMDSSWVCEDFKSEGSLIPTPTPSQGEQATTPLLSNTKVCNNMDPTMLTYEAKLPSTNNIQHRNYEFDFDLEEIMVMEALWQSIQDQGTQHGQNAYELVKTKSTDHVDPKTQFQVNVEPQEILKSQCQIIEPQGNDKVQHQTNWKERGLASAIATLAEQLTMKKQAIFKPYNLSNNTFLCECEPIENDNAGEFDAQPYELTNVETRSKAVSKNLSNTKPNKIETCTKNNLHGIAMSLETIPKRKQCIETSNNEFEVNEAFINECQYDQCFEQVEDGASTSTHSAHSNNTLYVAQANSPNATINRCACDINENMMLPRSFEEQMMLAMALSIANAH